MSLRWYVARLSRMGPREVAVRAQAAVRVRQLRGRPEALGVAEDSVLRHRRFTARLAPAAVESIPTAGRAALLATAENLMDGRGGFFGVTREDLVSPDWSFDPRTGRHAPADGYSFAIPYRDEAVVGDIKQLWELSRHQHLTVLAAAFAVTGDERYANRVADHLKSWWAANPPLRGVHWVSGIELGIRLVSWVWVRRLLDGWPGAPGLFEDNPEALHQIWHHQRWLATFPSHGSSANNHVVAELAGQLTAACAFPWFHESSTWRWEAREQLDRQLALNTFPSGLNREQATEYHGLVLELGLAAAVEAEAAGIVVPDSTWLVLRGMTDALATVVDTRLQPPRQGDADDGHGLVVDGDGVDRWASLLSTGDALFGRLDWWPHVVPGDVRTVLLSRLAGPGRLPPAGRPPRRRGHLADAGMTILRAAGGADAGEIWCRCDGGPHGFLSIAAHAHADALAVEVRVDGVAVLADPGTYCYHGEPRWRSYFRSTAGHNTLELDGTDQSTSGGPFLWTRHADGRVLTVHADDTGRSVWSAEHDGYGGRGAPVVHRRTVELDAGSRELRILDEVHSRREHACRLSFHLGPDVVADLDAGRAVLRWPGRAGDVTAELVLAPELAWSAHRGESDPPLGWYSPGFGRRQPSTTLVGRGMLAPGADALVTTLYLDRPPR